MTFLWCYCGSLDSQVMVWQDWWDEVKNQLDKPDMDKKKMKQLYEEMDGMLGDSKSPGFGSFRRKFIQVHNLHYLGVHNLSK